MENESGQLEFEVTLSLNKKKSHTRLDIPFLEIFKKKTPPTPTPIFETYWQFAKLRQDVFFARTLNQTDDTYTIDPVIQRYRFTNVYRASDRVSQYLIKNVLYGGDWSLRDIVFRALVFKFFNKIETWEALKGSVGEICLETYDFDYYDQCLSSASEKLRVLSAV